MRELTIKMICAIYLLQHKTALHAECTKGNNHAVSLPEINRAFNTVIKPQSEI